MSAEFRRSLPALCPAAVPAWAALLAVLTAALLPAVRACGYDVQPLAAYGAYLFFHVFVPGAIALAWVNRGPVSLTAALALGVPTGFALEIGTFLGLAALGLREAVRVVPLLWLAGLAFTLAGGGRWPVRWRPAAAHAGPALALGILFLVTTVAAASHLYAESPLAAGLPQRPIFHDWVFLVSRAGAIKNLWPLEDPSLAGAALQYHYFMLVHVASASWATGLELTQVLLRLAPLPLGAVLTVQAYALGRALSRSVWGGVLAALLTVSAGELGFHGHPNESLFLGRFVRWLFVSPTFYFGMIFFGALLLALVRWRERTRAGAREFAWLALLGAAATGAKGTVMPVVLAALALWALWEWGRTRTFPRRLTAAGLLGGAMFVLVYLLTMRSWGTGAAALAPGDIFGVSEFWKQHHGAWTAALAAWLPPGIAAAAAGTLCGAVVFFGTMGIRSLALPYLALSDPRASRHLKAVLGAALAASGGMGMLMKLDADGELYVFLLIRLPAAVLTAGFVVAAVRGFRAGRGAAAGRSGWTAAVRRHALVLTAGLALAMVGYQMAVSVHRKTPGWNDWLGRAVADRAEEEIGRLEEALLWVRKNTEPRALLVASPHTAANMKKDRWGAVDGALTGVHYYYSALSERRMLVEGTLYLLDTERVSTRLELADDIFYRQRPATAELFGGDPAYLVLDRAVADGAKPPAPPAVRVFANPRIEIYRLPGGGGLVATAGGPP